MLLVSTAALHATFGPARAYQDFGEGSVKRNIPNNGHLTGIVLFTRDLRVHDQPALAAAARDCEEVVPLFVFDERLLAGSCGTPNRVSFLLDSLRDLDASLRRRGGRLILRRGDPVQHVIALASRTGARCVYMSADVSAYAVRREHRLRERCAELRIDLRVFDAHTVAAPGEIVPAAGDHYRVFTPYWRRWSAAERRNLEPAPRTVRLPQGVPVGRMPSSARLAQGVLSPQLPQGGETEGRRRLASWLRSGIELYDQAHDLLAADQTSRLSPYLHFGCVSAGEVRSRAEQRAGADPSHSGAHAYVRQLCWRDFHHQVLAARPDLPTADYRPRHKRWRRDEALARAWREGRTGLPIVDAGMRQLAREGFMHNRARMIAASYLTKTVGLDWRIGAAHFAELLVDCDLACNVGNWQWMAGTGNDTRPNRVLNPLRQARRFDPNGDYVRRYVPELAHIEGGAVHEPQRACCSSKALA
jgi:deoxyribodipyrimidine photo-lyase